MFRQKGRSVWEKFVLTAVMASSLVLSLALYARRDHLCKSRLMTLELETHRQSLLTHLLLHKRFPQTLVSSGTPAPLTDPFGRSYLYDLQKGWVSSQSPGYQMW